MKSGAEAGLLAHEGFREPAQEEYRGLDWRRIAKTTAHPS